ncbi:type II toxin-antitoxin system Phd/YefM family antitoxin [Paracraurococcus lichenis]|uniref:Antitoxin n=1 Tax=Paracraurococcus lichenis TaxID=3064888 RepID=A0ABT9DYX9_9PROT|nr:type II toxin-antitoxin system prevent-host-death family antitoxin [Paracraurococcus sp. LOR1-02]MDO9709094.1 type II toxin-antitoxin system prevent-host-death family antitoxin [Paracraurococcus sp. LOR1-02]
MPTYTATDAQDRLPALLDASERGESVTITRHGRPVVELRPIPTAGDRRVNAESIDWLERQLADLPPPAEDSVAQLDAVRGGPPGAA